MRKEVADIWCAALRSGEFKQGYGYLDLGHSLCPLGILTNLAMTVGICDCTEVKGKYAFDGELGRLPVSVQEWAGMYGQSGEIRGEFVNLTAYGDLYGYTLKEIACVIEENYERL